MADTTHNSKLKNKFVVSSFLMILTFGIGVSIFIQKVLLKTLTGKGIDTETINEIIQNFTTLSLGFIIVSIVVFVLVSYRLATFLTASITKLHEITIEIQKGNFDTNISSHLKESGDEIGELAQAFEEMLAHIQESNKKLEEKVKERTKELEEARESEKEKMSELEKANQLMVGRELKMIELKDEITRLKTQLERR